jgi:hypothetical protein
MPQKASNRDGEIMSTARIAIEEPRIAELLTSDAMQPACDRIAILFGGMTNWSFITKAMA